MSYKINSDIKPLSATLKRLNIGKSFLLKDFKFELEEKRIDDFWNACRKESGYLINNLTTNVEEKLAEIFIIGVSLLYERSLATKEIKVQNSFNLFLTTCICYHIKKNTENLDYTKLINELEKINLLSNVSIYKIKKTIEYAKKEVEFRDNFTKIKNKTKEITSKNNPIKKVQVDDKNESNRKYQIFISSTFTDLIDERQAAVESILKKGHIPAGMELFTAGDKSQWEVIKKWIDESDIYLLILGGRYGSIDNETGLSYTEMEYNYALEKKIPFFTLSLSDDILNNKSVEIIRDFDLKNPKYISFKERVKTKMCSFPKNIDQIKIDINHSLDNLISENKDKMSGWIKGNK